jgi:hypothetical protein
VRNLSRVTVAGIVGLALLWTQGALAEGDPLLRIDRADGAGRNDLIAAGVSVVAETNDAWLAVGALADVESAVSPLALSSELLAVDAAVESFALVGLRTGTAAADLAVCGRVVTAGDGWHLVASMDGFPAECLESPSWFIRVLDLEPFRPQRPAPEGWAGLAETKTRLVADPLVQEMVDLVDTPFALSHWQALSESPDWFTRHSSSQGCFDAVAHVFDSFSGLGLDTAYQHHTGGFADNVVGTITGLVEPDKIYVAVGHIDDLPSSGPAPGADDNASGTAMVTAAAEVMSGYCFDRTVTFLAVTGEEQGLYGSDHYADEAAARGDDIQAVLNADMIGWEGDGYPAAEDLDINYNSASQWLAQAMVDAAAEYGTGMAVNAFLCSSMTYSDHAPFWANGYAAVCGITDNEGFCGEGGNYPHYHQSSDTIANCGAGGPDFEAAAIRTYVATLAHLARPIARIPQTPVGLAAQADGDNRIALSWSAQDPGIAVRIYRSAGGCANPGPPMLVGETTQSSFVDITASGGVPYGYTVAAAAADVCTSASSVCVDATTSGACTEPPNFVGADGVVNAATSSCQLTVDWEAPDQVWCGGPVAYNVYRSATPDFDPTPAHRVASNITTTHYDDLDVVSGDAMHYIVRAVDLSHGNEDGNTQEVVGTPTGPFVVGTWFDDAGDTGPAKLVPTAPWAARPGVGVSGAGYSTGPYSSDTCAQLTGPEMLLDASPQLTFWSKYDIEEGWDKGELQISNDGGAAWNRVPMTYPGTSTHDNDECGLGEGTFFTGTQPTFTLFSANLAAWAGQTVALRWEFSSDVYIEADGWWIDDISITDVAVPGECFSDDLIFADGFESGDLSAWGP